VTAVATRLRRPASENSKLIDSVQMQKLTLKGRDLFGMMVTLTGRCSDAAGYHGRAEYRVRPHQWCKPARARNFTVDGITNLDTGSNGTSHFEPNMDSIAEMRVLTSNYQAEYGRNANGVISIVTKGGSREFHGTGWVNKRHEMFNAKSFFQNYNGQQKSVYRFFVGGYGVGGPVYIPGRFHTPERTSCSSTSRRIHQAEASYAKRLLQYADRGHEGPATFRTIATPMG
jgi:hypothetical protein